MGNPWEKGSVSLAKYATALLARIYAILVCAHEIQTNARS
jgi:hypothetical protein